MIGLSNSPGEGYDDHNESGEETDELSLRETVLGISDPQLRQQFFVQAFCQPSPMNAIVRSGNVKKALDEAAARGEIVRETGHPPAEKVKDSGLSEQDLLELMHRYPDHCMVSTAMQSVNTGTSYVLKTTGGRVLTVLIDGQGGLFFDMPQYEG